MSTLKTDSERLEALESRLRAILPEEYQDNYENVQPTPMGSAGMKYDGDGNVAWNEMWATFCDLAMAGGPPHKGRLLEPGSLQDIDADPERYEQVVDEICRGVELVTDLAAQRAATDGWVRVFCLSDWMAGWLLRAITMENVAVRADGRALFLPAGPHYRVDKEIKNVVTVIAKTCHYWLGHMSAGQQRSIAKLFATLAVEMPLIVPQHHSAWRGVERSSARAAIWTTRALVASNVLARREGTTLFLPVNADSDPGGAVVASRLVEIERLAGARGIV